jgi:hypothetical protein
MNTDQTAAEAARGAQTIALTERNVPESREWLSSIGIELPEFPERCLHGTVTRAII